MDRWIAARPWEPRSLVQPENPKKTQVKKDNSNTNSSALKLQGSISLSNNVNDRKVPKKKLPPSTPDQKKSSPSPTDQKKPSPSPPSDQKKAAPKEQRAKTAGTPAKPKAKEMKVRPEKQHQQQQVVPSVSA
jgi:hypothetical protein